MEKPEKIFKIEISHKTIIFTVVFLILLQALWLVRDLLFSLFIAFIIMSVGKPLVDKLKTYKIPRSLSAILIFIILFWGIGYALSWIMPLLITDMTALFKNLSRVVSNLDPTIFDMYINGSGFEDFVPNISNQIFPFIRNFFSNIIFVITTIFFSFYLMVEQNFIKDFLNKFFKEEDAERAAKIFDKAQSRMAIWFRGEIILMTVIGILTYIGLTLIGVKHALSLAVIAGLLEVVPIIGPVISAIPAVIFAANQSYFLGLSTVALYVIIQQLENNLIVPVVMKRAVGLNKIMILIVLIIGGKLGGILGLFIALPLTLFIETILLELAKEK